MGVLAPGHAGKEQKILKWLGGPKESSVVCVFLSLSQGNTHRGQRAHVPHKHTSAFCWKGNPTLHLKCVRTVMEITSNSLPIWFYLGMFSHGSFCWNLLRWGTPVKHRRKNITEKLHELLNGLTTYSPSCDFHIFVKHKTGALSHTVIGTLKTQIRTRKHHLCIYFKSSDYFHGSSWPQYL